MNIPAAMHIETALDELAKRDDASLQREVKEFREGVREGVLDGQLFSAELSQAEKGYLIGLETARVMLAFNPITSGKGVL